MVTCELCNEDFSVVSKTDFKNVIWKQGNKFEEIKDNELVDKLELYLCWDCKQKIFAHSKVTINFSQELLEALNINIQIEVEKEVKQICL